MQHVLIGIQARSGSTRLPRKAFELIGGKMMLDHVIESCKKASSYVHKKEGIYAKVVVLTPDDDPIAKIFASRCDIVEGPTSDVLARYLMAVEKYAPDLVVRITGDCPLIPSYIIARTISTAYQHGYDYVANVDERFRTAIDGTDCEAMSTTLLEQAGKEAKDPYDREHVTTWIRREQPEWAKIGAMVNYFDHSSIKLSVDTRDDLERVRSAYDSAEEKLRKAIRTLGQTHTHVI